MADGGGGRGGIRHEIQSHVVEPLMYVDIIQSLERTPLYKGHISGRGSKYCACILLYNLAIIIRYVFVSMHTVAHEPHLFEVSLYPLLLLYI